MELSINTQLRALRKRERQSIGHYLKSIDHDSNFVAEVVGLYSSYPAFANLRCGRWYAPRSRWDGMAHFKSTDGHTGRWAFSSTRMNLHFACAASEAGGVLLVDSTRQGKRFPDSLCATVPIWCAVINRVMASERAVHLPPWMSPSERDQIETCVAAAEATLSASVKRQIRHHLRATFAKPFRAIWISPATRLLADMLPGVGDDLAFTPVICVSASEVKTPGEHRERHSWVYVQGAGDDEEHWSRGLTPELFWAHRDALLAAAAHGDVDHLVAELVATSKDSKPPEAGEAAAATVNSTASVLGTPSFTRIDNTGIACASWDWMVATRTTPSKVLDSAPWVLVCGPHSNALPGEAEADLQGDAEGRTMCIPIISGKRSNAAEHWSTSVFPQAIRFVHRALQCSSEGLACVLVSPDPYVASTVLCALLYALFDDDLAHCLRLGPVTKDGIRSRLTTLQCILHETWPPRYLMKELTRFFFGSPWQTCLTSLRIQQPEEGEQEPDDRSSSRAT